MMRRKIILIIVIAALTAAIGCSSAGNMTSPTLDVGKQAASGHQVWYAMDLSWDGVSDTMNVIPNRILANHYNVTAMVVPEHVSIIVLGWNPNTKIMTIQATFDNPSKLTGYDVRGIINRIGEEDLVNPDDYTKLFDTHNPKHANPFRAFAKDVPQRAFAPAAVHSEIYELYFPTYKYTQYIITAAWPNNAPEPYDIVDIQQSGQLYDDGSGSLDVTVEVLDWQDVTASDVVIEDNPVTGGDVHLTKIDDTHWQATLTNSGVAPVGAYEAWVAAYDATVAYPLYNKFTIQVVSAGAGDWGPPILIDGDSGMDKILPRLVLREEDYWVIYTDGTTVKAKQSTDGGYTWSAAMTVGTYPDVDTIHAVVGGDGNIYAQYQRSDTKDTYVTEYDGSSWLPAANPNYHGMTLPPYSCDLGISADGYIFDMLADDWSTLGFRSTNPYDITDWTEARIEAFYNGLYSMNDGFVQWAAIPKFFYVHEETTLDYASYETSWVKGSVISGTDTLIEPAIAPESDDPYHCVIAVDTGSGYEMKYIRFDGWPPLISIETIFGGTITAVPTFHSISVEGDMVSIFYEADGKVWYVESNNGGLSFGTPLMLGEGGGGGGGGCSYTHIRRDAYSAKVVAAYAKEESGDWNIYIRMKG